jgi:hypothetical protein
MHNNPECDKTLSRIVSTLLQITLTVIREMEDPVLHDEMLKAAVVMFANLIPLSDE